MSVSKVGGTYAYMYNPQTGRIRAEHIFKSIKVDQRNKNIGILF